MMRPGGMQFTVMPCLPTSRDRPLAHECIAALAANAPFRPSGSDLPVMLTIRPHFFAIICGSRRCASWRWRVKLRVSASSHCASLDSSVNLRLPPALLIRISTEPRPAKRLFCNGFGCSGLHEVLLDDHQLLPELFLQLLEQIAPARDDREPHALARERAGDSPADSHARAGDQRCFSANAEVHGRSAILPDYGTEIASGVSHWRSQIHLITLMETTI